jgi:hypothetical protein
MEEERSAKFTVFLFQPIVKSDSNIQEG